MLERTYINMLEKICNMEIQSNMLAKNRNIGHWWRFWEFSNMPPEPFPGAFDVIRTQDGQTWERRTQEAYFFESGADPILQAAKNIFFPSFLLFVLLLYP